MLFVGFLFFIPSQIFTQTNIYFFIDSNTIIGNILNNQVYVSESEIAYTLQGNLIFQGDSKSTDQILFTVNAKDILSKKVGLVYQNDAKTIQYLTQNGEFFLGDHPMYDYKKLVSIKTVNDSLFEIYSGVDQTLLGVVEGRFESQVQIVITAHLYVKHYHLDEIVKQQIEINAGSDTTGAGYSLIRPLLDRGPYEVWEWNGKSLKPAYGYRPEDEWKFDGRYLRPAWNLDPQSEWEWDGKILKPTWDNSAQNQWIWENNILKSFWDPNPDLTWILEDGIIRPMWNFNTSLQWEITGAVPLPIIALVILGKADL